MIQGGVTQVPVARSQALPNEHVITAQGSVAHSRPDTHVTLSACRNGRSGGQRQPGGQTASPDVSRQRRAQPSSSGGGPGTCVGGHRHWLGAMHVCRSSPRRVSPSSQQHGAQVSGQGDGSSVSLHSRLHVGCLQHSPGRVERWPSSARHSGPETAKCHRHDRAATCMLIAKPSLAGLATTGGVGHLLVWQSASVVTRW